MYRLQQAYSRRAPRFSCRGAIQTHAGKKALPGDSDTVVVDSLDAPDLVRHAKSTTAAAFSVIRLVNRFNLRIQN